MLFKNGSPLSVSEYNITPRCLGWAADEARKPHSLLGGIGAAGNTRAERALTVHPQVEAAPVFVYYKQWLNSLGKHDNVRGREIGPPDLGNLPKTLDLG